jgi:hypothetical protein
LLATHGTDVTSALPDSADAVGELMALLRARGVQTETLEDIGQNVVEDICVLTRADDTYRLTAGILCFPNRWKLKEKLGGTLLAVHGPVPDYATELAAGVDRFLARLRPMRAYIRSNWGLASIPDLFLPEPVPPVDPHKDKGFFLRREAQTFLKLPETGAVIFAIRTTVTSWESVAPEERDGLLAVIATLTPAWRDYKSIRPQL